MDLHHYLWYDNTLFLNEIWCAMKLKLPPITAEQLESAYASVETGESALRFAENAHGVGNNALQAAQTLERILPPLKVILSGLAAIYLSYKYINKFRKKEPTTLRVAGASINLSVTLITLGLALTILFVPALIPLFTLLIVVLGIGRETFNLAKTTHAHVQSRHELQEVCYHINLGPDNYSSSDYAKLIDQHLKLSLKHIARQYKLAHHVADVIMGLLCLVAVILVMTMGPVGWIAFAAVALAGLALKISLSIAKNIRVKRARMHSPAKPKSTNGPHHYHSQDTESEGPQHHPHRTAEIVDELQLHPHRRDHVRPENVSELQTKLIANDESKLFEAAPANDRAIQADDHELINDLTLKPTPKVDDEDEEGEGESPRF